MESGAKDKKPSNPPKTNFRRSFLLALIISLSLSAVISVIVFAAGEFGNTQARLLFTTLAVGVYSLTGLCCSNLLDKNKYTAFAFLGIIASAAGFLYSLFAIWSSDSSDFSWKALFGLLILAVAAAHASLLLLIDTTKELIQFARVLTLGFIALVTGLLLYMVFKDEGFDRTALLRLLGIFAVLDVLGTIVTPMLRKLEP